MTAANFQGVDVAIEFSTPEAAFGNIERLAALGVNTVVGTTGWFEQLEQRPQAVVTRHGIGLVWSPNFSIGVNVFARLVAEAARLLADETGVRSLGLGDSPHHQEGRAVRERC